MKNLVRLWRKIMGKKDVFRVRFDDSDEPDVYVKADIWAFQNNDLIFKSDDKNIAAFFKKVKGITRVSEDNIPEDTEVVS